ncbi:MAG: ATP-binding protein [Gammaproteobacteria bacterium]
MTIKKKLYYTFAVTLLLFGASMASFFLAIDYFKGLVDVKIGNSMKEANLVQMILHKNHNLMLDINEILLVIHGVELGHELQSPLIMAEHIAEISGQTTELGKHIEYCQVLYNKDDSELRHFRKIKNSINESTERINLFIEMWQGGKSKEDIIQYYLENIHAHAEANEALLTEQYNRSFGEVIEQQDQFMVLLTDSQKIITASAMMILILIIVIVHRITRSISTPLEKLKEQTLAISDGNYDVQIKVTSEDEIGQLAEAFNYMAATISKEMAERKKAEDAQRRSQKMDAIGQLTGGIAHDFNNILAVILGNLELLEQQVPADDKILKRIAAMNKAGQRAVDLTKQLLSFSRRQATQLTVTNINQVLGEMESLLARSLTPEVEVEHQFADKLWLTEIDPGDFEDALLNLSINARDAMAGHGHLTIETRNATLDTTYCAQNTGARPGQYVQLSVSDNGEGIPIEQQELIFEPFFTTKDQGKGTGLGLAMVYGFVKRSGGYINVYSEPGIGTTFRLYLPRAYGDEQLVKLNDEQAEDLPRGQETILAVDDEALLLELTRESLEALGYRVLTASDGWQALARLDEEPSIDLLFSDVVMPGGINGYELAEQATTNRPELKVLLTSGYTEKVMAHNGYARFNENLLSKPYNRADLAERVRAILDT